MGQGKQRKLNSLQNEIGEPYTQDSRAILTRVFFKNSGKLILAEQSNLNFTPLRLWLDSFSSSQLLLLLFFLIFLLLLCRGVIHKVGDKQGKSIQTSLDFKSAPLLIQEFSLYIELASVPRKCIQFLNTNHSSFIGGKFSCQVCFLNP